MPLNPLLIAAGIAGAAVLFFRPASAEMKPGELWEIRGTLRGTDSENLGFVRTVGTQLALLSGGALTDAQVFDDGQFRIIVKTGPIILKVKSGDVLGFGAQSVTITSTRKLS